MGDDVQVPEISPEELVGSVEGGASVNVVDIRAPERLASGRIDIVPDERFVNMKGSELLAFDDVHESGLDPSVAWAVVCSLGNDSKRIAKYLNDNGYQAKSVAGGIAAWMRATIRRDLAPPPPLDTLIQFDRIGKGALGYVLVSDGEALVVDPPRHEIAYLAAIDAADAKVVAVADTHAHADYISGAPNLALLSDAPYYLHPADAVYPYDGTPGKLRYEPVEDGAKIRFGRAEVEVVHTPGHTEGHCTYRLGGHLALTGDFIFIQSVGRPDLGGKTDEWTPVLWRSLERAKSEWPTDMRIYPAHYASAAERNADHSIGKSFEDVCRTNAAVAIARGDEFTAWVKSKAGAFPDVYRRIKAINVGLEIVNGMEADELEAGKNECALG